jgi:hypothetical protein
MRHGDVLLVYSGMWSAISLQAHSEFAGITEVHAAPRVQDQELYHWPLKYFGFSVQTGVEASSSPTSRCHVASARSAPAAGNSILPTSYIDYTGAVRMKSTACSSVMASSSDPPEAARNRVPFSQSHFLVYLPYFAATAISCAIVGA